MPLAQISVPVRLLGRLVCTKSQVVEHEASPLLGLQTSTDLGLVRRSDCVEITDNETVFELTSGNHIPEELRPNIDPPTTFGAKTSPVNCSLRPEVPPVAILARRLPLALIPKVKSELDCMQDLGIIESVNNEVTDWCSPMLVVTKKNGNMRLSLDPRVLNKAIKKAFISNSSHGSLVSIHSRFKNHDNPGHKKWVFGNYLLLRKLPKFSHL